MALQFPENKYPGVNAHLNSYMQEPNGTWASFHHDYISMLKRHLNAALPSNYFAIAEKGLQISEIAEDKISKRRTSPDVSVIQQQPTTAPAQSSEIAVAPTATMPLADTLKIEEEDNAIVRVGIYESEPDNIRGKLITAIEVLSPSNKPTRGNNADYVRKRVKFLLASINLIEIDLIHELLPITYQIPSYPDEEENAQPYNILVSIPQPDVDSGKLAWYGVEVDKPLPKIAIPLLPEESTVIDLNAAYNDAFMDTPLFWLAVDYATEPRNFNRYSATDQQKIRTILEEIRTTQA